MCTNLYFGAPYLRFYGFNYFYKDYLDSVHFRGNYLYIICLRY